MRNYLCATALALSLTPLLCASAAAQLDGTWRQASVDGVQVLSDKCRLIWLSERSLTFGRPPGSEGLLVGSYVRADLGVWLMRLDPNCKIPGTFGSAAMFQRTRGWDLLARPLQGAKWEVGAQFNSCEGMGCDEKGLFESPFSTTIEAIGGRLAERSSDDGLRFSYRSDAELRDAFDSAQAFYTAALADLDGGNCIRFYQTRFERSSGDERLTALCEAEESLRRGLPAVVANPIVIKLALNRVPGPNGPVEVDDILLLGFAKRSDGSTSHRGAILHHNGSRWFIRELLGI